MPSNQYNSSYTGTNHDTYVTKEQLIDLVYPVGSYYMSESSTNPTVFFGGSWEQIKDRFILAAGDSYTGGATGGSSSHSHTTNAGTTGGTAITIAQMPSHNHGGVGNHEHGIAARYSDVVMPVNAGSGGADCSGGHPGHWLTGSFYASGGGAHTHTSQGSGSAHTHSQTSVGTSGASNMPPYLVAYIWKRIA